MAKPDLSIIIPLYGKCEIQRLKPALDSLIWQSDISLEIILTESNLTPMLDKFAESLNIKYYFLQHPDPNILFSPGRIRNFGVLNSLSDVLYITDSDVVFQNRNYMANLFHEYQRNKKSSLRWPPMRRIPVEFTDTFIKNASASGLDEALSLLSYHEDHIAIPPGESYPIRVLKRKNMTETGQIFTTRPHYYRQYFEENLWRGLEPLIWHQIVHIGGILLSRKLFDTVGGYCEEYTGWGNEDIDIQWKLIALDQIEYVENNSDFEVLHIDHDKPYLSKDTWTPNKLRFEQRKKQGFEFCIKQDRDILLKTNKMLRDDAE